MMDGKKKLEELVARRAELPGWFEVFVPIADLRSIFAAYKAMEAERDELREIISECATALGNGAHIDPNCTVEFMSELPREIELRIAALRPAILEEAARAIQCGCCDVCGEDPDYEYVCANELAARIRALAHTTGQEG